MTIFKIPFQTYNLYRRKFIINELKKEQQWNDKWKTLFACAELNEEWFILDRIKVSNKKIEKYNKNIYFLKQRLKEYKAEREAIKNNLPMPKKIFTEYDKDAIKQISIRRILEQHNVKIIVGKKFALRNEKTPSCWIYEDKNTYTDFGDGNRSGDVIDLYQRLNNIDFHTALKELNNLI